MFGDLVASVARSRSTFIAERSTIHTPMWNAGS